MTTTQRYITIIIPIHEWNIKKNEIKKIIHNHQLEWLSKEVKQILIDEITARKYGLLSFFNNNKGAEIEAKSGIWKSEQCAIKIFITNNSTILIYKSLVLNPPPLWKDLVEYTKEFSAIIQTENNEIIFMNIPDNKQLIDDLNDKEREIKLKIENFKKKIDNNMSEEKHSDSFKEQWIACIYQEQ